MTGGDGLADEYLVNGRYRVMRELGRGAMGSVHLVADTLEDDRLVALKTVRRGVRTRRGDRLFQDEFSAMAQLRHPNVVEVYDFGTLAGTADRFFTMEFVDGKNLAEASGRDAGRIQAYAVQICRALEYIHAHGFVHFDLKPDNIMVDASGVAKVMDFGLVERGSFFEAQMLKGTVAYIAPEMIRGDKVDLRLDLYSLGAVLFHVLTGRMLFTGDRIVDILRKHVEDAPDLSAGVPPPFDRILARLLAKNPSDRYASAATVLADLERPESDAIEEARIPRALHRLGSRLVGRDAQLGRLLEIFRRRALDPVPETPSTVLVTGASGMGKSRLMDELRHGAQIEGVTFLLGACIQDGGHSYLPLAEILRTLVREILASPFVPARAESTAPPEPAPRALDREAITQEAPGRLFEVARTIDHAGMFGTEDSARALTPTRAEQSGSISQTTEPGAVTVEIRDSVMVGETLKRPAQPRSGSSSEPLSSGHSYLPIRFTSIANQGARTLLGAHAAAVSVLVPEEAELSVLAAEAEGSHDRGSPGREKEWLIDSIIKFLVGLSRVNPLVLYCSDLQWADDLTVELFARLGRAAMDTTEPPRLMLCACFRDDEIAGGALEAAAAGLVAEGVAEAIQVGPLDPPAVAEMLRSMLGHVEMPEGALQVLIERTAGIPFSIEATLQDVLEHRSSAGIDWSQGIDAGEEGAAFAPLTVAEALDRRLETLSATQTAVIRLLSVFNRSATPALLRAAGAPAGDDLAAALTQLRARHLLQRARAEGSSQWSLRHARLREHVYGSIAPDERVRLHAAAAVALDQLYPGAERYLEDIAQHFARAGDVGKAIRSLWAAGDHAKRVYDLKRAATLYTRACDALETLPDTPVHRGLGVDLAIAVAEVSYYSPSERIRERLEHALEVVEEAADAERRARVFNWLGRTNYALGHTREATRCFQEFMRLSEGSADDLMRALPYRVLGNVDIFRGRFEQARDHLQRGVALLRGRRGAEEELSYVLGMYGGTFIYAGEFARAEELTLESIALAEKIGHRTRIAQGQIYLGIVYAIQGEWPRARAILERGIEVARHDGNVIGAGTGSSFLGLTDLAEGDARRAVERCRFAREHIAEAGGTITFSMVGAHLAEALLACDEPAPALAVATETRSVVEAGEHWGACGLYLATGRIHARLGDAASARRSFAEALDTAEQQRSPPFVAKAHLATGVFLMKSGDESEGSPLVERALASFEALAMPWYADRARMLLGGTLDIGPCP